MDTSTISAQLHQDYPGKNIILDAENQMLKVGGEKNILLLSTSAIERMNIFSAAGKHFYQVIVNLIYSRFGILPKKGSFADSLVITEEEIKDYRIRKIARRHNVGFLENGKDVFAIDIDDGKNFPLLSDESDIDPLEDEDWETGFTHHSYSLWRNNDPSLEELEIVDEDSD